MCVFLTVIFIFSTFQTKIFDRVARCRRFRRANRKTDASPEFGESRLGLRHSVLSHVLLDVEVGVGVVLEELGSLVGLALAHVGLGFRAGS